MNPAAIRWPPPPALVHARPTSTLPLDLADTSHWPSSDSLKTTATSASSVRRSTSITGSATSRCRPYAARSARLTVVQTRPWPAAASGSSAARPSTQDSRPRYPNGALSHSSSETAPGSMPVASSCAAISCTRGEVLAYLKEPVSVTIPAYRPNAMSVVIRMPSRAISSCASTAVAAAAGSIRCSVPNRVLDAWWSSTISSAARAAQPSSMPRRSALAASKVTMTSGRRG